MTVLATAIYGTLNECCSGYGNIGALYIVQFRIDGINTCLTLTCTEYMAGKHRHGESGGTNLTAHNVNGRNTGTCSGIGGNHTVFIIGKVTHAGTLTATIYAAVNPTGTHSYGTVAFNLSRLYVGCQTLACTEYATGNLNAFKAFTGVGDAIIIIINADVYTCISADRSLETTAIYITIYVCTFNA